MEETGSLENPILSGKCYLDLNRAWKTCRRGPNWPAEIDPARVAESCSQRRHRGRCEDAPSWCAGLGKVRLGCDVAEGVGRSQSVIVVRVQPPPSFLASAIRVRPPDPDKDWGEVHAGGANRIRYHWRRHLKMTLHQLS